jgi:hypothetical protein
MSSRDWRLLLPIAAAAVVISACASEKPVAAVDVAPVLAAVVHAVDSAVGPKDSLAVDPRILPSRSTWRWKQVATAWSEGELAATISARHPRLELGKMAYTCPVATPGCVATKNLPVVALSMPMLRKDTAVVEAAFAGRGSDDMVNEVHWVWFAVRKDSSWRVVRNGR